MKPLEVKTDCPYGLHCGGGGEGQEAKEEVDIGRRRMRKVLKKEGEFDPTLHATVLINKEKVMRKEERTVDKGKSQKRWRTRQRRRRQREGRLRTALRQHL